MSGLMDSSSSQRSLQKLAQSVNGNVLQEELVEIITREYNILKRELEFQGVEIQTLTKELELTKEEIVLQNKEKQKKADQLVIANIELVFQNHEKQRKADELIIANNELIFQNQEKQNRADELIVANKELAYQNNEKQNRADELILANKELAYQNSEKQKRAIELTEAYGELEKTAEFLRDYSKGLEEMIFITSHKVRQPIAHILGISNLLDSSNNYTPDELNKIVGYIKKSAISLEFFTRELTDFMTDIRGKVD